MAKRERARRLRISASYDRRRWQATVVGSRMSPEARVFADEEHRKLDEAQALSPKPVAHRMPRWCYVLIEREEMTFP